MTTSGNAMRRSVLDGIRVVDFTMFMAGPYCTRYLADLGADVIKVEPPAGDYLRSREPLREGLSSYFGHLNAGKRSVVLDLKQEDAVAAVKRLIARADIVVENGRPGVMKRLGLDYESLSSDNPRLIYCSISGFGQTGPGASRPAYAQTIQAASGFDLAFLAYQDDRSRPANTGIFVADVLVGVYGFSAIMTALHDRSQTGKGSLVDVTMIESMLNMLPCEIQDAQVPDPEPRPAYKPFRTKDGYVMVALVSPKNFEVLFEAVGHPEKIHDPLFSTTAARMKNWDQMLEFIENWTTQYSSGGCVDLLTRAGIPVTKYNTVADAMRDQQLDHRGSLARVTDAAGDFLVPNLPFHLSDASPKVHGTVPRLGEHTQQVLDEIAGLQSGRPIDRDR